MHKILSIFTPKFLILLLTLIQFGTVLLMALGVWPDWVVWINVLLSAAYLLAFNTYYGLLLLIASVPFYVALPNPYFDSLSTWRVLFAFLAGLWLVREYKANKTFKSLLPNFFWDKYLAFFLATAVLSLVFAKFLVPGIKQIIFWLNIWLLYAVVSKTVKSKEQVIEVIKYSAASLAVFVAFGYAQLIITFFTTLDYFWSYWAVFVSKLYYGQSLASVLFYSNSWFSFTSGAKELRMFGVLPDSHSFAAISAFAMMFLLPLTYLFKSKKERSRAQKNEITLVDRQNKIFGLPVNNWIWAGIRTAGLAIVLSGTRAIWAGLAVPFVILAVALWVKFMPAMSKKIFLPFAIIILFFVFSPLINQGLHMVRVTGFKENFIDRAKSIYDLNESSNMGRLAIWKNSLGYAFGHPQGAGVANFLVSLDSVQQDYSTAAETLNERFNLPQRFVTAHNLYLHVLVEMGVLGLVAFVAFWLAYISSAERFVRKFAHDDNIFIFFIYASVLIMIWFLAAGMFDVTFYNDKVLMYFFISLALTGVIMRNYQDFRTADSKIQEAQSKNRSGT